MSYVGLPVVAKRLGVSLSHLGAYAERPELSKFLVYESRKRKVTNVEKFMEVYISIRRRHQSKISFITIRQYSLKSKVSITFLHSLREKEVLSPYFKKQKIDGRLVNIIVNHLHFTRAVLSNDFATTVGARNNLNNYLKKYCPLGLYAKKLK